MGVLTACSLDQHHQDSGNCEKHRFSCLLKLRGGGLSLPGDSDQGTGSDGSA